MSGSDCVPSLCSLNISSSSASSSSRSLKEARRQNEVLTERIQSLQAELSDAGVRRAELEAQLGQSHNVCFSYDDDSQSNTLHISLVFLSAMTKSVI